MAVSTILSSLAGPSRMRPCRRPSRWKRRCTTPAGPSWSPRRRHRRDTGAHIAIAWEASPEAARTIAVSIQALTEAEKVTILAPKLPQPLPLEPADLVARLLWHGVNADIHEFDTQASDLGAAFLAHSAAVGADMLVKGAYSQSRLRQMVLGGRTRHILNHTTVPTLLAK